LDTKGFDFKDLQDVENNAVELGVSLPLSENMNVLRAPITVQDKIIPNRLAIQPMEGCDGNSGGGPEYLVKRRYERFAKSGAGLIWFEAVAVVPESRANPRQLMLTEKNLDEYKQLVDNIKSQCNEEYGFTPIIIMQATHSGRYSKPVDKFEPFIAYNSPIFEKDAALPKECIVSDDYLKELEEHYAMSARLAELAGFDGVDVKACHRYLICELLSAYTRPGEYGGSFENRIRFFLNAIKAVKAATSSNMIITSRMNIYDGFPHPYGWGVNESGTIEPDMSEPEQLINILHNEMGVEMLNFSMGNPYFNPHVTRPFDKGGYESPEHPIEGVARMCDNSALLKSKFPNLITVSSGYSYLRQFSANLAAGMVESGKTDIAGFGREAFAYPKFAGDILQRGKMDETKCCIACGKCSEMMRANTTAGCVIRDTKTYFPIYKRDVLKG